MGLRNIELKEYSIPGEVKNNISVIGDLHYNKEMEEGFLSYISGILNIDNNTICFVGDILDEANIVLDEKHRNILKNFIKDLSKKHKVKIVLGKHDIMSRSENTWIEDNRSLDFYKELDSLSNVEFLNNQVASDLITRNTYVGVNPGFEIYKNKKEDKELLLKELKKLKYIREKLQNDLLPKEKRNTILLMHSPYLVKDQEINKELEDYNLILSGICDNARGYKVLHNNNHLIITGGITKVAGDARLKRFLNNIFPISIDKISIREDVKKLSLYKSYIN